MPCYSPFVLANENIPNALADWMLSLNLGPWGFLLVVNLLLLVAGNFMEPSSIILIMAPILFPTAMTLGINPVHFGILIDVNMEVGLCHPPVGLNLYVASGISKIGITELTKAVLPWLLTMLVFLVIVTYWPWLTLVLPQYLGHDVRGRPASAGFLSEVDHECGRRTLARMASLTRYGSDGGIIVADDEHPLGARITLGARQ